MHVGERDPRTLINLVVRDGGSSLVSGAPALAAALDAEDFEGEEEDEADQADADEEAASDVDELDTAPNGTSTNGHSKDSAAAAEIASLLTAARELSKGWVKLVIARTIAANAGKPPLSASLPPVQPPTTFSNDWHPLPSHCYRD